MNPRPAALARTLGFRDLLFLVIGGVIGSGIFLTPGPILKQVGGSVGLALAVWIVGGLLSLLGALTYGELAAMLPETGGLYIYIRDCFGRLPAYLYGWTLFLVVASGSVATLAVAFSAYLGQIVPLGPVEGKLAAVAMIFVVTAVNIRGTRASANLQNWTTLLKLAAILAMSGLLLVLGRGYAGHGASAGLWPARWGGSVFSSFGLAMIAVLWAYEGWQFPCYSAGEAASPQRDFPRAFFLGTAALIGVYVLANLAYLAAVGPSAAGDSIVIAADSMRAVLGPGAGKLVALMILVSTFSAANSIPLTAPRVFFAMAADGLAFRPLARVHPRFGTPALSILVSGVWSAVLASLASFQQLFTYVIFAAWIFYGLAAASVFVYRRRRPDAPRPFRVPGYPWSPLLFVLAAAALVLNTIVSGPGGAAEGLGIVLLGLPVYFLFFRRRGVTSG